MRRYLDIEGVVHLMADQRGVYAYAPACGSDGVWRSAGHRECFDRDRGGAIEYWDKYYRVAHFTRPRRAAISCLWCLVGRRVER